MATTFTYTATFVRLELIKMQVRVALRRTTKISQDTLSSIEKGLDKRWIKRISVYAIDNNNLCRAQLVLEIDWDEYNIQMSCGKVKVSIDERWIDNTAIEIDEAVQLFNRFVAQHSLSTKAIYNYVSNADHNEVNRELGFVDVEPIKWAQGKGGASCSKQSTIINYNISA